MNKDFRIKIKRELFKLTKGLLCGYWLLVPHGNKKKKNFHELFKKNVSREYLQPFFSIAVKVCQEILAEPQTAEDDI